MKTLTVEIEDEKIQLLEKQADKFGISLSQLLKLSIDELFEKPEDEVNCGISYILEKNKELYSRLAK